MPELNPNSVRIVGVGAVTALGQGVDALWQGALEARVALAAPRALDLADIPGVQVGEALPPTSPEQDRAYLLAEAAALEATDGRRLRSDAALVVASTKGGIALAQRVMEGLAPPGVLHHAPLHALAARLARTFRLRGPVQTLSVACASGTTAVGQGLRLLRQGRARQVLVVGADALCEFIVRGFSSLRALSRSVARPFDTARDGLSVGEGAGALLLEAGPGEARALVCGYGGSSDANHITGPARDGAGLQRAVRGALADAGVDLSCIRAISAHGTATRFNDAMENAAWTLLLGGRLPHPPAHGLKGAIGHTMGAAGAVEAVLCVRALETGLWPPTAGLVERDPELELDVSAGAPRALPGPRDGVLVSTSSGFAGINAAVVLCEAP